jgi:hypothetical protein
MGHAHLIDQAHVLFQQFLAAAYNRRRGSPQRCARGTPHFLQITVVGVGVQFDRFVRVPIGFQQAQDEGVFEPPEDAQVKRPVFLVRDLDAVSPSLACARSTS